MNCYYSNLIEGHNTHPVDIERALKGDYSEDPTKRDLQVEAKAHIEVQRWIDAGGITGRATAVAGIQEVHRRFCELLPDDLLWVEEPKTGKRTRVIPGQLRRRDVSVGRHIATSPGSVPRFMDRFESVYGGLGKTETIVATAAAHHRLLWIHPFLDGNGRVARLMSHATLLETLDTGGVWSVARGLALSVTDYKHHLAECDLPRRNDLDGRGSLSEENLAEFTRFFLKVCLDQVTFMENLVQPDQLATRVAIWAEEQIRLDVLPPKSGVVLRALLYAGEIERGQVQSIVGTGERQARRVVAALMDRGVLSSTSPRAPLQMVFPAALAARWMPGLFPEQA
jgi:Fic family protein